MNKEENSLECISQKLIEQMKEEMNVELEERENLLTVGLSSLTVMKIMSYWRKKGYQVKFSDLIKNPYVYKWAEILKGSYKESKKTAKEENTKQDMYEPFDMTDVQYSYWIGRGTGQMLGNVGCHGYFETNCQGLDLKRLKEAWHTLLSWHPMLRARFLESGKQVIQKEPYTMEPVVYDYSDMEEKEQERELLALRHRLSHRLLKIEEGQVISLGVSLLGNGRQRLHFDIDLLVCDVQSFQIILRDLASYYTRKAVPPVVKEWNFAAYLKRQSAAKEQMQKEDKKFWEKQIDSMPEAPKLPIKIEQITGMETRFHRHSIEITAQETNILENRAKEHHFTLAMILLTAYGYVISKWSQNKKFLMNVPLFNRDADIENVVADFTNLILIPMDFEEKKPFAEYVKSVQEQFQQSIDHSSYSGIQIIRDMKKKRDSLSLVPVVYSCNLGSPLLTQEFKEAFGDISYMISQTPQVLIDFQLFTTNDGMLFVWDAVDEAFPEGMVSEMFQCMTSMIKMLAGKETSWEEYLDCASESQKKHRIKARNFQVEKLTGKTLLDDFFQHVEEMPDETALVEPENDEVVTYGELADKSLRLAGALKHHGIKKGDKVAVIAERCKETIIEMLAVLNCGGAYIPVQASQPPERIKQILKSADTSYVVGPKEAYEKFSEISGIDWIDPQKGFAFENALEKPEAEPEDLAYIIFTSGSTGVPKGVEIRHEAAMNTILTINKQYGITKTDKAIGVSSFDFDLSVYDIFGMLQAGGKLILVPQKIWRDASAWADIVENYQITVWNSVPTLAKMLLVELEYQHKVADSLRYVFLSGDWIGMELPGRLYNVASNARLIAMGGATEASIWSNYIEVTVPVPESWKTIPYGKPLYNQFYRVVDSTGEDCPDYVTGELWIGGAGVAAGYTGDKKLTDKKFVWDFGKRWYRTGDAGRFWGDNTIEFIGRMDHQVKVRGHRIELGEIEAKLKELSDIEECVVLAMEQKETRNLAAFLVPKFENRQDSLFSSDVVLQKPEKNINYHAEVDIQFFDYCESIRKDVLYKVLDQIDKDNFSVPEKYQALTDSWRKEIEGFEPNGKLNFETESEKRLECFLKPFVEHMSDLMSSEEKRNALILQEDYISPNEFSEQTMSGAFTVDFIKQFTRQCFETLRKQGRRMRILEVGARSLESTKSILEYVDADYVLLDSSRYYLNRAKEKIGQHENLKYVAGSFEDPTFTQFDRECFDMILFNNTLHQFEDVNQMLYQAESYLERKGVLIFAEMEKVFPLQDLTTAFFQKDYRDERRQSKKMLFTKQEWKKLLQKNEMRLEGVFPEGESYPQYIYVIGSSRKNRKDFIKEVDTYLKTKLPEYMIPHKYYFLEKLPVTRNGKVDRKKLNIQFQDVAEEILESEVLTETELKLQEIWESLLGIKPEKQSNYFRLGGDSLLATQLSAEIEKVFQVAFSIETVFNQQTLMDMAAYIETSMKNAQQEQLEEYTFTSEPEKRFEPFPLTAVQQAYWLGRNEAFQLSGVSTQCYFEMDAQNINFERAEKVWNQLIESHDMLRGQIKRDGQFQMTLQQVPYYRIKHYNVKELKPEERIQVLKSIREEMSHEKHDMYQWPLFDIRFAELPGDTCRIYTSFDNILFDGWSMFYLLKEWNYLYQNPKEEPLTGEITFRDYVLNYEKAKQSGNYEKDLVYWKKKLERIYPAPQLPVRQGMEIKNQKFVRHEKRISKKAWMQIKNWLKDYGITPAAFFLSAYAKVIERWSTSEKFSLNLTHFNRVPFHPDVEKLVGDFTALTIHSIDMQASESFLEQTRIIQKNLWEDLNHPYVSGVEIERLLNQQNQNGAMPVVFTCGLGLEQSLERKYDGYLGEITFGLSQTPQVWLDNQVSEEKGELNISWDTPEGIFPEHMIAEMFQAYINLIERLSQHRSDWEAENLDLLLLPNKQQRENLNHTDGPIPEKTMLDAFYESVHRYGEKAALETSSRSFTYTQLNQMSNALAEKLRYAGLKKGDVAAFLLKKGWEQIVSMLAVLKCGAAYLPLKYENPYERNREILKNSGARVLIWKQEDPNIQKEYQNIRNVVDFKEEYKETLEETITKPDDTAYIIYTSGTTGVPKGVAISHKGAMNTIVDINERLHVTKEDKTIAISDSSFDLSVYDIFGMFEAGGCIVVPNAEKVKEPEHWLALLDMHAVTIWNTVPMYMQMLTGYLKGLKKKAENSLRAILLSGDWIPLTIREDIQSTLGKCALYGLGGATEASIWSNIFTIDKIEPQWNSIPYGKPLRNQRYYILNSRLEPRPNNVPGDLYIGGTGLASCYWKDRENTRKSFLIHPVTGERLYRTGDLALYMEDGNIAFCGRQDNQVKINGFRIELGEIDSLLLKMGQVKKSVTLMRENELITFILAGEESNPEQMKTLLAEHLPDYMIPAQIIEIDEIPLTLNGKVDRDALLRNCERRKKEISVEEPLLPEEAEMELLWKEVLGVSHVGIHEKFIFAGGDSLKAVQAIAAIQKKFDVELSLNDFFTHPTIRELTKFIKEMTEQMESGEI